MTEALGGDPTRADRAASRSPMVQRSRTRSIRQAGQIVDAAIELTNEKGSAFTIQELAKRADVALQTFYRHFAGKDELLLAVIKRIVIEPLTAFQERAKELPDPLTRLRFYVTMAIVSLGDAGLDARRRFVTAEHYRLHQLFPDELSEVVQAYRDLLIPEILAAADAGLLTSTDAKSDAWYITTLVMATYHHYSYATSNMPAEQLSEILWNFCLRALGGSTSS